MENILATRYASISMQQLWSVKNKIILERKLWLTVLKAQQQLGVKISDKVISDYESMVNTIDLISITNREKITKHDVKARIEEFNALAGHEEIHKGMTSRDLTENIEQYQLKLASEMVFKHGIALGLKLCELALYYESLVMVGRSHNVPAQVTTLGKRFATAADELYSSLINFEFKLNNYRLRGIKGPIGTAQDMLDVFEGDTEKLAQFEKIVLSDLGFGESFISVGQVYPRNQDFQLLAGLVDLAAAPSSFATTIRLMAGNDLVTEGFKDNQVGSSAMPHKMNARSCERINGFMILLRGYANMASELSGSQWNEGDVSCSVVRRVILPDAYFALDGLQQTFHTILNNFRVFESIVAGELSNHLPFLATTKLLIAAIKTGMGRESAYEIIKKHAITSVLKMRETGAEPTLISDLAAASDFPLSETEINNILADKNAFIGLAKYQVAKVSVNYQTLLAKYPEVKNIKPIEIL